MAVDRLPSEGRVARIEANADERAALARRFDLCALESMAGELRARALGSRRGILRVEVSGRVTATVVQTCVVTLQPVEQTVDEAILLRFSDEADGGEGGGALDLDPLADIADEGPEPLIGGTIDLGEVLSEALGLALDPYPRAEGATIERVSTEGDAAPPGTDEVSADKADEPDEPDEPAGPFAALAALRDGHKKP
jgi:uncharacterized metal-binding protein YceD (DUF177 family)